MAHDYAEGTDSLVMNEKDDVATVLRDAARGDTIQFLRGSSVQTLTLIDAFPFGHKVAIAPIAQGAEGKLTKAEILGHQEFSINRIGPSL
ncbi:D-galactarate dehydratase [Paenibacillus alba]|uniref:SAF domain-containing protein n=1 Tax=Paenibacillus alba TaxID=1197127 RepID=A0ABU6G5J6_9BACL|nr:D-galactarate dehydratase [Paenibacillus alba]MEC0229421.1 SAF domain-containing protein [Paenibacillus alba]